MTAVDAESCAVVAAAADIICSLRGADLAGWTPPWRKDAAPALPSACDGGGGGQEVGGDARGMAWPAVARGKRSRSRRAGTPSASGSASAGAAAKEDEEEEKKKKKGRRGARGSPASPLDYSGGSGSGASTSGGEDGAFCSQPAPASATAAPSIKVGGLAGRRSILPVPPPRPAGQRPRKKMRLPEIQQLVRSLSVENDALREEMKALQRACTALSKENGKLETRLDHSSKRNGMISAEDKAKPKPGSQEAEAEAEAEAEQDAGNGFVLPDLNLPADD
ncbi:hypothetical protein SEVIR_4G207900v4 [Setaria viridis]|uniref:BZIP domain-containing protein n=1 Tax=Setaria viridis TaxID=4556 RepID=A0A4U6UZG9_SETVI|nr:uncharacterized protein LOC117853991 isoform X2 [Setaria viridis]TKW22118.1 hypothetical protein SEVIR_4G207900v2 [Setaria viridis]